MELLALIRRLEAGIARHIARAVADLSQQMQVVKVNGHRLTVRLRVVLVRDGREQNVFDGFQLFVEHLGSGQLFGAAFQVFELFADAFDLVDGVYGQIGFVGQRQAHVHAFFDLGVGHAYVGVG